MIGHYFKVAKKILIKNKFYTLINMFGLICGMLSVLIISKYIGYSMQFDNFHLMKDRIYSVLQKESFDGNPQQSRSSTYWGIGDLISQFPEVNKITRYSMHVPAAVIYEGPTGHSVSFIENKIAITDSSFLRIFTFPLLSGDSLTVLSQPNSVVLTKSASQKYFGDMDPIGRTLAIRVAWGEETIYTITGVIVDVPKNSRFQFDLLINRKPGLNKEQFWDSPDYSTYLLLNKNANSEELVKKQSTTLEEVAELKSDNRTINVSLESISSFNLSVSEYLLVVVGILIMLLCWVNYFNQVIAQSYWRIKEVSIQKVLGATRTNLWLQFLIESTLNCLIVLVLIIGLYIVLEQKLLEFTGGHLLPIIGDNSYINYLFLAVFFIGIFITGAIPATILFSKKFDLLSQEMYRKRIGGVRLRRILVILQFSISLILLICIFVIKNQLDYISSKDKGIEIQNILVIKAPIVKDTTWKEKKRRMKVFKAKCRELPITLQVASSTIVPSEEYRNERSLRLNDRGGKFIVHQVGVDENYFSLYKVKFLIGHGFNPKAYFENMYSLVLNESAARGLGIGNFNDALDVKIYDLESDKIYNLIGIVKDFHETPLKYKMEPMVFKFNKIRGNISIKFNGDNIDEKTFNESISQLKEVWSDLYQGASFDYFFLDRRYKALNLEDQYYKQFFYVFTSLSIIISCLGLFGMSLLISEKRQMEIGIRRVFGASSTDILAIFFKSYLVSLLFSIVFGSPIGIWLMNIWLQEYAYKVELGIGLVFKAIISVSVIFILTISYHVIKSAHSDPVKVLRES